MTAEDAATLMGAIAAVGVVVDAAEVLATRSAFAPGGIYDYAVVRTGNRFLVTGPAARPLARLLDYPGVLVLPAVQLACAAILLALPFVDAGARPSLGALACALIVGARTLFYARNVFGQDGSDQMLVVVLISAGIAHLGAGTAVATILVAYAAGQLLLAYLSSGIAKAVSPVWRSGRAVTAITRTIGYGNPRLGALLERHPRVSWLLCWSVIAFECLGPLLVLGGREGALALIAAGLCFHVGIAAVMGLNVFVWSFAAAYPAVLVVGERLGELLR